MYKESIHPALLLGGATAGAGTIALLARHLRRRRRRDRIAEERPEELPGQFDVSPGFSSSNVADAAYNPDAGVLEVGFHSGGRYRYYDVPPRVWRGFRRADSKGGYLHRKVKEPGYSYEKLSARLFRRLNEIEGRG